MKPILRFAALILIMTAVAFVACEKDKDKTISIITNPPPPPLPTPQGKTITARVVEYNTGNPIARAIISLRPNYPSGETLNLTSDDDGVFSFDTKTNQVAHISAAKTGYWDIGFNSGFASPVFFFPDTTQYNPSHDVYTCDSFVIKLFPTWNITVHVKDTSGTSVNAHLLCQGIFNLNGNTYQRDGSYIPLRAHIDSTFQLQVFGNINNKFGIWACGGDDDCFMMEEILNKVQYIANGTYVTMNIFY